MGNQVNDLLGRPLRDLRISVTDRCNFRCTYCMPSEIFGEKYHFLNREEVLSYEEIKRLTEIFIHLGVRKVRITGGEPLVRRDIDKLIAQLSNIEEIEDLTLTTNGYLLAEQVEKLQKAGLRRITVSLDSLDEDIFAKMNGKGYKPDVVLNGIKAAEDLGLPVKVNAVIERGVNDNGVLDLVKYFKGSGHILRFIEFMDVGNVNGWARDQVVPSKELCESINKIFPIEPVDANYVGEVAERWKFLDGDGEIGFISSITQPFCQSCTRARLSPEGFFFTCLFANSGIDLKTPLRAGESNTELLTRIRNIWENRTDRYSELRNSPNSPTAGQRKIEMFQIGG
ncbi:MAG: GTP 3',8-cyclase MoaA [Dehalococcoidia bacterium]|nr:GTP 3',8-cyclase MoaA [Dehalococcoidia bacterium]HCH35079.1 GTP 3',8-cyclase MoaA [Dehalococcoidia bacterium]|tara:strand:- start:1443 stop:2462 length:1020 start_codon:yes stop_codon:yes gene_type:complete